MVVLLYCMRRVDCRSCGVRVEAVPWGIGKHQLTKAYMLFLAHWARKDQVRAGEARRLARDGYEPVLKKTRWCVLKRKTNLTRQQRFRLRDLLRYNLQTVRAYLLKEDFQQLCEYEAPSWAGKFLDDWCCQVMRSRIEPMKKIARTLRSHRALILNYFRARKQFSSGVVEGLNNKAKLTMRKSYGFRTFHVTEIALYHALGKLPEPDVAHRFF
jgi:transposase